jgi:hypothetical protein
VKLKFSGLLSLLLAVAAASAQTTAFNYQGQLSDNAVPANGWYDFRFTLHDTDTQPGQIGGSLTNAPVNVVNGLFTVALDFGGDAFDGSPRWLQIGVRSLNDVGPYTALSPRQPVNSVPYAIRALTAGSASNLLGTLPATNLTGTIPDARLSTNVALLSSSAVFRSSVTATQFNGGGAGLSNVPAAGLTGTVPDARLSANVALLNGHAHFQGNLSAATLSGNGVGLTNVPGRIFEVIPTGASIQAQANFGYLATNETSAVVVTLPVTMRVGETVRVAGSGAGGWAIAQNAGQMILVGNLLDNTGFGWVPRENSRNWKGIASSADGNGLVAVVNGGQIFTSTNYGVNWTARDSNRGWSAVASDADGVKLVASVNSGYIYTSTDSGANWTPRTASNIRSWASVASSLDGTRLIACAAGAGVFISGDSGGGWSLTLAGAGPWSGVASSGNGSNLVAVINGGQIYTSSSSGASGSWIARDSNRAWVSVASSTDGGRLVAAVNGGDLYVSTDFGTNWFVTGPGSPLNWTSVASSADGARLAAVINLGGIHVSTDSGANWQPRNGLPLLGWTTVASSADGSTLAAAGSSTQIYVASKATTTLGTAGRLTGARLSAVELEYLGNGQFMPISYVGTIRAY